MTFPSQETIAEGHEGGISEITFELERRLIDCMVLVSEDDIRFAIRYKFTEGVDQKKSITNLILQIFGRGS